MIVQPGCHSIANLFQFSGVFIWNFKAGLETDLQVAGVTIASTSDVILSGTVTLGSTSKLTGGATFDSDAIVTINGVLDFDISGLTPDAAVRVDKFRVRISLFQLLFYRFLFSPSFPHPTNTFTNRICSRKTP